VFYEQRIRNMRVFVDDENQVQQALVSELKYTIDFMQVFQDKVFVASSEREITVYDLITFRPAFGKRSIKVGSTITGLCATEDFIFVATKEQSIEVFHGTNLEPADTVATRGEVSCFFHLDDVGLWVGQEDGFVDIIDSYSPFSVLLQDRHPFCDTINFAQKTSRIGTFELAVVTAGQVYFTSLIIERSEERGLQLPKKMTFELDEMYIDEGA